MLKDECAGDAWSSADQQKEITRARNSAYRLLTYRPRSRVELETKLRDKGFDQAVISQTITDLQRLGYVNDPEFARQWVRSRTRTRGFGRFRLEQELRNKGISREIIRESLSGLFSEESEIDLAFKQAEKKIKSLSRFDSDVRRRRIAGFLERRGYPSHIIRDVIRNIR